MTGVVRTLAEHDALLGAWCLHCGQPFQIGERVVIEPDAPAWHQECIHAGRDTDD